MSESSYYHSSSDRRTSASKSEATSASGSGYSAAYSGSTGSTKAEKAAPATPPDGAPHRSPLQHEFVTTCRSYPTINTPWHGFVNTATATPDAPYLGTLNAQSEYEWLSYSQVYKTVQQFGTALAEFDPGQYVGFYARNSAKWVMASWACAGYGMATAAMYDTLGAEALVHCMRLTDMRVVFVQDDNFDKILSAAEDVGTLTHVITEGKISSKMKRKARDAGVEALSFDEVCKQGRKTKSFAKFRKDDINTICFTSGTTGVPKGVMLTHANLMAGAAAAMEVREFRPHEEVHLSYLPLAHIFERQVLNVMTLYGGRIGFFNGDVKKLSEDFARLQPTILISVPRLMNRLYEKVMSSAKDAGGLKSLLFNCAVKAKTANLEGGPCAPGCCCWPCGCCCCAPTKTHWFWDAVVFRKVQQGLGGRVQYVITGSAPLDPDVLLFFRAALGVDVLEGYGQSEAAAAASIQLPSDPTVGHVGFPVPAGEIALQSVPDMNYYPEDVPLPKGKKLADVNVGGEVCQRGPLVMQGYLNDDENTRATIDEDGWLHTGDIGRWLPGGQLQIIDRKKVLFKLSHGEYVAPEKVENVYLLSRFCGQCWVYGESKQSSVVGVVVLRPEEVTKWSKETGNKVDPKDPNACEQLRTAVLEDMQAKGKSASRSGVEHLRGFEQVAAVYLEPEEWTQENGMLTPTSKLKRSELKTKYKDVIEQLYKEANSKAGKEK